LKLPSRDKGIDLLARINNKYYAIQCKFRQDPNEVISWTELSTFFGLSFGITNKIAGGFFVTNTRTLCQEVIDSDLVVPIYDDYYDSIPRSFFRNIDDTIIEYKCKYPLRHQNNTIISGFMHYLLDDKNRGFLEMACGGGKTLTSYWLSQSLCPNKTIVFVPSLHLLSQFYVDWVNQSYVEGKSINYILIGSDADIDEVKYKGNGLILTTDPDRIKECIKDNTVVICTYQSSDKLAEACGKDIIFDFGIFDECHRTVGQKNKQFSRMLRDKHMIIKQRLFMTATPKDYDGDNDDIVGMNNEAVYGENIYTYNTGQAIADNRLTDYQLLSIVATNKSIRSDIEKNKLVKYKNKLVDLEANYLGIILVLLKKFHDGTINHLITYHGTVLRSRKFAKLLVKINKILYNDDIFIESVDGSDSMNSRNKIIRDFNGANRGIICSARVFNEGVNIPIVDSVCFVDARESVTDIIQCVGRSLRLYPGKNMAYVIIPVFIENFDDDFDKDAFGTVIKVIKSMKNTDERIVEWFRSRDNGGVGGNARSVVVMETYGDISKKIDFDVWEKAVGARFWKIVDQWICIYDKAKNWIEKNGRIPSMNSGDLEEKRLAEWCNTQRRYKKLNYLSNERIELLNQIIGWYWNSDYLWDSAYEKLIKWIKKYNKMPLIDSANSDEKSMGRWCAKQKRKKINNKLSQYRIDQLEKINIWFWNFDNLWNIKYLETVNWINHNNKIPSCYTNNRCEKLLGSWCRTQRRKYKKGNLTDDKIDKLNKIVGWFWNLDNIWDDKCSELEKWIDQNNKMPSITTVDPIEKRLGELCRSLRQSYKNNKLTKKQIKRLGKITGWYWNLDEIWNVVFAQVQEWFNENGKLPSSTSKKSIERSLGRWCCKQRVDKLHDRLSDSRINKLNTLPTWFWKR